MNFDPKTDNGLEALLRDALGAAEPIPARAMDAAFSAFQLGMVDDLLAELLYDSLVAPSPVLMRGSEGEARLITFANDHLTLDVTFLADRRTVVGSITPLFEGAVEIEIEAEDGGRSFAPTDQFGRFRAEMAADSVRFRVAGRLVTPWISR